ncbi:MAG: type II toxin-antitoxin system Phd/YefM family antitoxin [Solirubrobacterales bacterium]
MASREIPQRELRNNVGAVLREVEAGASIRVTVRGRPVADLVPIDRRTTWVPWSEVDRIRREAPLDPDFTDDVASLLDQTVDEIRDPWEKTRSTKND